MFFWEKTLYFTDNTICMCEMLYKDTKKYCTISSILLCDNLKFRDIIIIRQMMELQKGVGIVYQIGDMVVYGMHGVCRIVQLDIQRVNRKKVEYFVLEPISQSTSRFFVPAQNETALAKLRRILTKEEIENLVHSKEASIDCWNDDENSRKQAYKELLTSCDCLAMIRMLRTLQNHKKETLANGKKFHIIDANFMRDAEKVIYSEFSLVLGIPYEQVEAYIQA